MEDERKPGSKFAVGCTGCLGLPVLLFGLYYAFGHPFCIDAPCTDTAQTGGVSIAIGALLVTIAVVNVINIRKYKRTASEPGTEPSDEA